MKKRPGQVVFPSGTNKISTTPAIYHLPPTAHHSHCLVNEGETNNSVKEAASTNTEGRENLTQLEEWLKARATIIEKFKNDSSDIHLFLTAKTTKKAKAEQISRHAALESLEDVSFLEPSILEWAREDDLLELMAKRCGWPRVPSPGDYMVHHDGSSQ